MHLNKQFLDILTRWTKVLLSVEHQAQNSIGVRGSTSKYYDGRVPPATGDVVARKAFIPRGA